MAGAVSGRGCEDVRRLDGVRDGRWGGRESASRATHDTRSDRSVRFLTEISAGISVSAGVDRRAGGDAAARAHRGAAVSGVRVSGIYGEAARRLVRVALRF